MADTQRDMESTDSTTLILVTKLKNSFETSEAIKEEWKQSFSAHMRLRVWTVMKTKTKGKILKIISKKH